MFIFDLSKRSIKPFVGVAIFIILWGTLLLYSEKHLLFLVVGKSNQVIREAHGRIVEVFLNGCFDYEVLRAATAIQRKVELFFYGITCVCIGFIVHLPKYSKREKRFLWLLIGTNMIFDIAFSKWFMNESSLANQMVFDQSVIPLLTYILLQFYIALRKNKTTSLNLWILLVVLFFSIAGTYFIRYLY